MTRFAKIGLPNAFNKEVSVQGEYQSEIFCN